MVSRTPTPDTECPVCGHARSEHHQESWFDEEGVEVMPCQHEGCACMPMTWDWAEVLSGEAVQW